MKTNVEGLKELHDKLGKLSAEMEGKALRSAMMSATLPIVREMQAAAPKGSDTHRTYKGRLVAPGFLSRSVRRVTRINKREGKVSLSIGVRKEAFYGISFLDETLHVSKRDGKPIQPYVLTGSRWFESVFVRKSGVILASFRKSLGAKISRLTK